MRSFLRAHSPSQYVLLTLFLSGHCAPPVLIYPSHLESQSTLMSQNQVLDLILDQGLERVEGTSWFSLSGKNVILEQVSVTCVWSPTNKSFCRDAVEVFPHSRVRCLTLMPLPAFPFRVHSMLQNSGILCCASVMPKLFTQICWDSTDLK